MLEIIVIPGQRAGLALPTNPQLRHGDRHAAVTPGTERDRDPLYRR